MTSFLCDDVISTRVRPPADVAAQQSVGWRRPRRIRTNTRPENGSRAAPGSGRGVGFGDAGARGTEILARVRARTCMLYIYYAAVEAELITWVVGCRFACNMCVCDLHAEEYVPSCCDAFSACGAHVQRILCSTGFFLLYRGWQLGEREGGLWGLRP